MKKQMIRKSASLVLTGCMIFTVSACSKKPAADTGPASQEAVSTSQESIPPATSSLHNGVDTSKHRELTVITYSGSYQDIQKANLEKSGFEKEYNCSVSFIQATGTDTLEKVRNKEADVVFTDFIYSCQGENAGLFEKLETSRIPNLDKLYDFAKYGDYTVLHDIGVYGIAYNPELVQTKPEHWTDLWKEEYSGKEIIRSFNASTIELMVHMAKLAGGDEKNIDAGFAKMAELAPHIHTWPTNHSQILELFRSKDVAVGQWTDGRVAWASEQGVNLDFIVPDEGGFLLTSTMNIVKGTDNVDLAMAYMNAELSSEWQATHSEALGYFPTNKDAYHLLSDHAKSTMAFTPETVEGGFTMCDWPYIVTVYDKWSERWEKEVLGGQ